MIDADFFRSLNLVEDLARPERFAHYRPTRRALPIVEAVVTPGAATMVIAPYGSGKSLAAGVGALQVRNDAPGRPVVETIAARIGDLDANLADAVVERSRSASCGAVVVLSGLVAEPLAEIATQLGMSHAPKSVEGFGKAMREGGWDHVAIVWDEFGRHLEGLVAEGRSSELDLLQRLAERVSRASAPTMSLTLLLHQNLLAYATRLNETSRTEWRKVEGRFRSIRMVEDSQEFYRLVGSVVEGLRPEDLPVATIADETVAAVIAARWFDGVDDIATAREILETARPLTAGALQVLPTLVARVGQNERSLFSFLREMDLAGTVGIEAVYEAFSDAMRTDVGIGGTYRRWIETESARSRAREPIQREILAAACLLQLGISGERRRLPRAVLELAVGDHTMPAAQVSAAIDDLVAARLLLWRRHNDDVAVWHGADIDVAHRVREERERRSADFDIRTFLEQRFPAPHLRAPGHNAEFGVNRFLAGRYVSPEELRQGLSVPTEAGAIAYVLAEDRRTIEDAVDQAKRQRPGRTVVVVPDRPLELESAALELVAIEALRQDEEFVASDPMVVTEIDELQSVAFGQLAVLLRGLLDPRGLGSTWIADGKVLDVTEEKPGTMAASRLLGGWYSQTPRIANEQLMRATASRTMQTARVRVVQAILERGDRERLGYEDGDRSAEGSIYRTVIENTGLRPAGATRFADPMEIKDPGLREVWMQIMEFFRVPTKPGSYRGMSELVADLEDVTTGVPRAVMPILVAAGYSHFARSVAIYRDGTYVPDIMGFGFDAMVAYPEGVTMRVEEPTDTLREYLSALCYVLVHERPAPDVELIRAAQDAVQKWLVTVSDGTRRSKRLTDTARALLRVTTAPADPVDMLIRDIPAAFGAKKIGTDVIARVERARNEIDHLREAFADEAVVLLEEGFRTSAQPGEPVLTVKAWADCFDAASLERRGDLRIVDRSVLRKALETAEGRFSPKSLANALSSILLQRSLDKWDDRTSPQFRAALREARARIEAAALDVERPAMALRPIVEAKVRELNELLARIDGGDDKSSKGRVAVGSRK
ncbi:hypothetical protein [Sphingomonas mollis]|uniref:ATP-binding protein n=1 Tax=Sphingomonas mollis TaxID=2795726 RepID=A0ABS0XR46_9SPHN|nr:hypothetical protein [Sphingomonas sp. BT553]MBJ6122514.1 hypothetical protein [Sphingomonas sp. BT553]